MTNQEILSFLPYSEPFLFVDSITSIDEQGVKGQYTFLETSFFYKGHFKNHPITPGVILTETMAQIGVVCLGIFLLKDKIKTEEDVQIALSSNEIDFYIPVYPGETVTVTSTKKYFRFGKLKCQVEMRNENEELVCRGSIAGMLKK